MAEPIRIVIIDDSGPFRAGLRALIGASSELDLAGEAQDGASAVDLVAARQPDVVLMDLNMPHLNGIEATRRLLQSAPHVGVLVVTMFEDDDSVLAAMQAGARGYLLKGASRSEIVRAIRTVAEGGAVFGPAIARRMQALFDRSSAPNTSAETFPELSPREREVLDLIANHLTNPEIADRLSLTEKTVRNYVSGIFAKLGVSDRSRAIRMARDAGFGRNGP